MLILEDPNSVSNGVYCYRRKSRHEIHSLLSIAANDCRPHRPAKFQYVTIRASDCLDDEPRGLISISQVSQYRKVVLELLHHVRQFLKELREADGQADDHQQPADDDRRQVRIGRVLRS